MWCCNQEWETCTRTQGQTNICWANFGNPNENFKDSEALAFDSTAYSTLISSTTSTNAIRVSTSTVPNRATTVSISTATMASAAPSDSVHTTTSRSTGTVVGISIGSAISCLIAASLVALFVCRRFVRRLKQQQALTHPTTQSTAPLDFTLDELPPARKLTEVDGANMKHEMSTLTSKFELLGDTSLHRSWPQAGRRYERGSSLNSRSI